MSLGILVSLSASAYADRPVTGYVDVGPSDGDILEPGTHGDTRLIFLNRCAGGCTISPGSEDSRYNRSSIISSTIQMPAYPYGDESWNAVVTCVQNMFEEFDLVITDVDPGTTPHFEAIVSGTPGDAGFGPDTGGVAPGTCGVIGNSMNYTFAEVWGDNPQRICEVIAQETGHTFGMDHQLLCEDPMTYLGGCGKKSFQNASAQCGEDTPRGCNCGGSTQNSHERLEFVFGPAPPTPPAVSIVEPSDGAQVRGGFTVLVDASDNNTVTEVRLVVNGMPSGTLITEPYIFNSPGGLADGPVAIQAMATDNRGDTTTRTINVTLDNSCSSDDDCGGSQICVGSRCEIPPGGEGGLGSECEGTDDCMSGQCGTVGDESLCTADCDPAADGSCPDGFACLSTESGGGACWPSADGGGATTGGCGVGTASGRSGGGGGGAALALVFAVAALRRRRR
jgi:MYXO-CTERM domain-containing protein